jgi:hypothetical protein
MSMIVCDNCGIHADSDYGNCVFDDVHSFCSEECYEEFNNNLKGSNSTSLKKGE